MAANHYSRQVSEGKTWKDYVKSKRLEVACGEAPYLVSRYDATTACPIPISHRVGILDRKFRVIDENTPSEPTVANKRLWLRKALAGSTVRLWL